MNYKGSVIKLFKVANAGYKGLDLTLYEISSNLLQKFTNDSFGKINLNARNNDWSYKKLCNHLKSNNETILYLDAAGNKKREKWTNTYCSSLTYTSIDIPDTDKNLVELILHFDNYIINNVETAEYIFKEYTKMFDFDYGYIFDVKKNQDLDSEKKWKGFFSVYVDETTKEHNDYKRKLTEIQNGFVPKIYKYNLLNSSQIKAIGITNRIELHNNLYLYEENK